MKHWLILITLVIINPYEAIDYNEVNAYYFDNEISTTEINTEEIQEIPEKYIVEESLEFDDNF